MSISKTSSAAVLPLFRSALHDQLGASTYRSPSKARSSRSNYTVENVASSATSFISSSSSTSSTSSTSSIRTNLNIHLHPSLSSPLLSPSRSLFRCLNLDGQSSPNKARTSLLTVTGPKVLWHIIVNDLSIAISHKR